MHGRQPGDRVKLLPGRASPTRRDRVPSRPVAHQPLAEQDPPQDQLRRLDIKAAGRQRLDYRRLVAVRPGRIELASLFEPGTHARGYEAHSLLEEPTVIHRNSVIAALAWPVKSSFRRAYRRNQSGRNGRVDDQRDIGVGALSVHPGPGADYAGRAEVEQIALGRLMPLIRESPGKRRDSVL